MCKIKVLLIAGFFLAFPVFISGQTAAKLEVLLETPALSWGEAAAFILEASETELDWLPNNASLADTARLNGIALLLMQSFDIKGGIFYSLAKSPHHAYRELVYKNVIRGNTDPRMAVSGPELLLMVNRILAMRGE